MALSYRTGGVTLKRVRSLAPLLLFTAIALADGTPVRLLRPVSVRFLCCFGILTSPTLAARMQDRRAGWGFRREDLRVDSGAGMELGTEVPATDEIVRRLAGHDYVVVALDDSKIVDGYKAVAEKMSTPKAGVSSR